MDEVKILARGNLPLPPVRSAVLLSRLFVSLLAAFGEGSRQLWRAQFVRSSWDPSSAKQTPAPGDRHRRRSLTAPSKLPPRAGPLFCDILAHAHRAGKNALKTDEINSPEQL
jgi:hypothetical protein